MKTKEIVAGLVTLAAAITTVYIIKGRNEKKLTPVRTPRHLAEIYFKIQLPKIKKEHSTAP